MTWYAIKDNGEVIATADSLTEISKNAFEKCPYGTGPEGGVAPYYFITTDPERENENIQ